MLPPYGVVDSVTKLVQKTSTRSRQTNPPSNHQSHDRHRCLHLSLTSQGSGRTARGHEVLTAKHSLLVTNWGRSFSLDSSAILLLRR